MRVSAQARERRVTRRLESRGAMGLGEALVRLRGTQIDERWELGTLYGAGAEGAVFLCHDIWDANRPSRVAKIALLPYNRPVAMSFEDMRNRRERLRQEAAHLRSSASKYMPTFCGLFEFQNPLLDADRGGAFAETEPVLMMERLPGFDLDLWLARVHAGTVPRAIVRRNVDHVAVVVLRALWDLHERGFLYCDLRPGNIRIRGRSEHRVRLMDAGSLVRVGDTSGAFPHVPAYLPPDLFNRSETDGPHVLVPSREVQAVMAGRTLFEVATGRVPIPGRAVDPSLLECETVSTPVGETIARLCSGECADVLQALKFLAKRSQRGKDTTRTINPNDVAAAMRQARAAAAASEPEPVTSEPAPRDLASALAAARAKFAELSPAPAEKTATSAPPAPPVAAQATKPSEVPSTLPRHAVDDAILPPPRSRQPSLWSRLRAKFRRGR